MTLVPSGLVGQIIGFCDLPFLTVWLRQTTKTDRLPHTK
jgi:hypothetical protein